MANAGLFKSMTGKLLAKAGARNHEGAAAYALTPQAALAQYAMTGCLNHTFYSTADMQLAKVLDMAQDVDDEFLAKLAVYSRRQGFMKDMPALLLALLAQRQSALLAPAFAAVVDNGRMLRNFVQIVRSGATGRKSLGTRPKKLVQHWLNTATPQQLLNAAIGNDPSLADVVKMVHPQPAEPWRAAFFGWLLGKPFELDALPENIRAFEFYKRGVSQELPDVPFLMLTSLPLQTEEWTRLAQGMSWQSLRMNLNTLSRHGVFADPAVVARLAARLGDAATVHRAKAFPYQLMTAWTAAKDLPRLLADALQDALEASLHNVPELSGRVVVCPDVSGSMQSPATGFRPGATSAVRCIDVAALVAAALLRRNPQTRVMPFEVDVVALELNARDTVLTNAQKLAGIGGGGTNCSAPLARLNREKAGVDLVVFVSDNESWVDNRRHGATQMMHEWAEIRKRNPQARLVCIDVQPHATTQAAEREDILNIGGFSDEVFRLLGLFARHEMTAGHWETVIRQVEL